MRDAAAQPRDIDESGVAADADAGPATDVAEAPPEAIPEDMVFLSGGRFMMGALPSEFGDREGLEGFRPVVIRRGFLMMKHEVTVGQWFEATGMTPAQFSARDDLPVEIVDWVSAAAFANWRSMREGYERCYTFTPFGCAVQPESWGDGRAADRCAPPAPALLSCRGYRLPTEAEWEFAARAGTTSATYAGDISMLECSCTSDPRLAPIAWTCAEAFGDAQPIMQKRPNAWGLYDMLGSVWEWTNDWYEPHVRSGEPRFDPVGPRTGIWKVGKGGGWGDCPPRVRAAMREMDTVDHRGNIIGFRLVRSLPGSEP